MLCFVIVEKNPRHAASKMMTITVVRKFVIGI
jgi:hypothetical protein